MQHLIKSFCKQFQLNPNEVDQQWLSHELQLLAQSCPKERTLLDAPESLSALSSSPIIHAYSDGACSGSSNHGGWGVVICYPTGEIEQLSGAEPATTNNRMELLAAIKALEYIANKHPNPHVTITTDSQYVKNGITQWIFNWKKNGWKTSNKEAVKNQDLWQKLDTINQSLKPNWQWVRGHNGNIYNEICDELAVKARNSLE